MEKTWKSVNPVNAVGGGQSARAQLMALGGG